MAATISHPPPRGDHAVDRVRIPADRDVLEPVVPAGTYVYPNGIATAADGRLYVAHLTGIDLLAIG